MEGGNKVPINLAAGLDISSSDMIVPFNAQTFQHNWQKWQGKCLPNSLRFEHNGWAAGWNVYDFKYNKFKKSFGDYYLGAEKLSSDMYMLTAYAKDDVEELNPLKNWRVVTDNKILSGAARLQDGRVVGVIDSLNGSVNYELAWDQNTHKFTLPDGAQFTLDAFNVKDGVVYATVKDAIHSYSGRFGLYLASPVTSAYSQGHAYTGFNGNTHSWDGYTYDVDAKKLVAPSGKTVDSVTDSGHSLSFNYTDIIEDSIQTYKDFLDYDDMRGTDDEADRLYNDSSVFNGEAYDISYAVERYYRSFNGIKAASKSEEELSLISQDADSSLPFNRYNIKADKSTLKPGGKVLLDIKIPVWWSLGRGSDGNYRVYHQGLDVTSKYDIVSDDSTPLLFYEPASAVCCASIIQQSGIGYSDIRVEYINKLAKGMQKYSMYKYKTDGYTADADVDSGRHSYGIVCSVPATHIKVTPKSNITGWLSRDGAEVWYVDAGAEVPGESEPIGEGYVKYNATGEHGPSTGYQDTSVSFVGYKPKGKGAYAVFNGWSCTAPLLGTYAGAWSGTNGRQLSMRKSGASAENEPLIGAAVYGESNAVSSGPTLAATAVLEGHAFFVLEYTRIANESVLMNDKSVLRIRLADARDEEYKEFLRRNNHSEKKLVLIDRDELGLDSSIYAQHIANVCCDRLFKFEITGKLIDDRNGSGYVTVTVKPIGTNKTGFIYGTKEAAPPIGYIPNVAMTPFTSVDVADRYPSGVPTGFTNSDQGVTTGRTAETASLNVQVQWLPNYEEGPVSMNAVLNVKNRFGYKHDIYTKKLIELQNARCTVGRYTLSSVDADTGVVPIEAEIKRHDVDNEYLVIKANYECDKGKLSGIKYYSRKGTSDTEVSGNDRLLFNKPDEEGVVRVTDIISNGARGFIPLSLTLNFKDCTASYMAPAEDTLELIESDGDIVKVRDLDDQSASGSAKPDFSYSTLRRAFLDNDVTVDKVTNTDNKQIVEYSVEYIERFSVLLKAVFDGGLSDDIISVEYDSQLMSLPLSELTGFNYCVDVFSVDIREASVTKQLGSISPAGQIQLLKQAWNTTDDVENYWWVDRSHILELTAQHLILKRNTGRLHDWNGNIFENVWKVPRASVITGNMRKYFVPSAFEQTVTVFCTIEHVLNAARLKVYDIRKQFKEVFSCDIAPRHVNLGAPLNAEKNIIGGNVFLNTYSQLTSDMLLSKAEWSSTIVDDRLILGCHVSNNLNQWAIVINTGAIEPYVEQVIQGYGYVGLHGELTGGMLPIDYFKCESVLDCGFTGTVLPLKELDKSINNQDKDVDKVFEVNSPYDISDVEPRIYGTAEQQWYIQKRLHGIVSHLLYVDKPDVDGAARQRSFVPEVVPVTNNYEAAYASPSFYSSIIGDCMVQVSAFADLFKFPAGFDTVWRVLCGFAAYPLLFNFAPRFSSLCYLQQSLGQYAYVHYNSSRDSVQKEAEDAQADTNSLNRKDKTVMPVLSSEFIFDKQKVIQKGTTELNYFSAGIVALLISSFSEALQIVGNKQSVNEEQNQTAIFDTGKKFVENVAENTSNMLASAIVSQSKNDFGLTSIVTGTKSLDMFYSTSDSQRVFAGPGYTELQFVADCIAQSVTDTQVEGRVTQLYLSIKCLTTLQMRLMLAIEELTAQLIDKIAEANGLQQYMSNNVGWAIRMALHITAQGIRFAMSGQQIAMEMVNTVLDAFSANGTRASTDGHISRHALSVEGKHKYGEKNEVFMWPCWGIPAGQLKYSDESVVCGVKNTPWELALHSAKYFTSSNTDWANIIVSCGVPNMSTNKANSTQLKRVANMQDGKAGKPTIGGDNYRAYRHEGSVPFYQVAPYGVVKERILPDDMAKIEGVSRILPSVPFKNENIGVSDPAFAPSLIHDYILDKDWQLSLCATYGLQQWVAVRDTKIINGTPSNIIVDGEFCGIASSYTAIELKRGIKKAYMRPLAVTPNALALNCTGYNTLYDDQLYHAFDGMSCRLVDLVGSPGLNKNRQSFYYAIQVNDRFKRSNIIPAQEMQGNFETEPTVAMDTIDRLWTTLTVASKEKGLEAGTVGEDKDAVRWSVPVFTEPVSTLPACVKTLTAATLAVVEGVTGLVTAQVTDTNSAYKAPTSVDFSIGRNVYRATEEYICSVTPAEGGNVIKEIIPTLGLKFIGSTPTEAYFYSKATRCYYVFTGSTLVKVDMMERFRDIQRGYWDFVNQEVVMPCLMTFKRLNAEVEDNDTETDNVIVPVLANGQVSGELPPPLTTIFNDRSWYKCLSLPSGFAYQGPNRVIINRAVFTEYMLDGIKRNLGNWKKVPREKYSFNREYGEKYDVVNNTVNENGAKGVSGWTHNPFLLVTSALGLSENVDCVFEWEVTFCWPVEMDLIYGQDNYATVNILAETMTPGGKQESRPTHVFLTKELFTRNGNYGYYSFRFQSKNGSGNRERLKIWSDQYIAVSSVTCEYKVVTQRRTEQLTQQVDVSNMQEL